MQNPAESRVIDVEVLNDGVFITFDDGKCAIYSGTFLHANLFQADGTYVPGEGREIPAAP